MLVILATTALAAPSFSMPNSTVGVSVGGPAFMWVRGEAWYARDLSVEVGGGVPLATLESWFSGEGSSGEPARFDAAARWRPRSLCFGCGRAAMATLGFGVGTVVTPNVELVGPWRYAVGPDLVGTAVFWFSPTVGLQVTGRIGGGPEWEGSSLGDPTARLWGFGTVGFAF